jgi:hypothetical protein
MCRKGTPARYSVLLLYPDYLADDGAETYWAWVVSMSDHGAAEAAKLEAAKDNDVEDPNDFLTLAVIEGHHRIVYRD